MFVITILHVVLDQNALQSALVSLYEDGWMSHKRDMAEILLGEAICFLDALLHLLSIFNSLALLYYPSHLSFLFLFYIFLSIVSFLSIIGMYMCAWMHVVIFKY